MKVACDIWHVRPAPSPAGWGVTDDALLSWADEGQHRGEPGQLAVRQPWDRRLHGGADSQQQGQPGECPLPKRQSQQRGRRRGTWTFVHHQILETSPQRCLTPPHLPSRTWGMGLIALPMSSRSHTYRVHEAELDPDLSAPGFTQVTGLHQ